MKSYPTLALISAEASFNIKNSLEKQGFAVISLPPDSRLQAPVRCHADMLLCHIGDRIFCSELYCQSNPDIFDTLSLYGYTVIRSKRLLQAEYPFDVAFNILHIGQSILGKLEYTAQEILEYADSQNIRKISVKQGYSRCSTLLLDSKGIVCADVGIIKAADSLGIKALQISNSPEAVTLEGYDHGFIGGASGVFEDKVYFTGDVSQHPNGAKIREFCSSLGYETVSLTNSPMQDIGGILFLPYIN